MNKRSFSFDHPGQPRSGACSGIHNKRCGATMPASARGAEWTLKQVQGDGL
jgi:hypothetical protein